MPVKKDSGKKEKKSFRLIQTRVEEPLYKLVSELAESEGLSVAAYVRRQLVLSVSRKRGR